MPKTTNYDLKTAYVAVMSATDGEEFAAVSGNVHAICKLALILRQAHDDKWDTLDAAGNVPSGVGRIRKARETADGDSKVKVDPFFAILNGD